VLEPNAAQALAVCLHETRDQRGQIWGPSVPEGRVEIAMHLAPGGTALLRGSRQTTAGPLPVRRGFGYALGDGAHGQRPRSRKLRFDWRAGAAGLRNRLAVEHRAARHTRNNASRALPPCPTARISRLSFLASCSIRGFGQMPLQSVHKQTRALRSRTHCWRRIGLLHLDDLFW